MRPKLSLKSFRSIDPKEVFKQPVVTPVVLPPALVPRPEKTEEPPAPPPKKGWEATAAWVELPNKQFLRIVFDNRIGLGRRIYRVELYDKERKERIAIFRRQTEAYRR